MESRSAVTIFLKIGWYYSNYTSSSPEACYISCFKFIVVAIWIFIHPKSFWCLTGAKKFLSPFCHIITFWSYLEQTWLIKRSLCFDSTSIGNYTLQIIFYSWFALPHALFSVFFIFDIIRADLPLINSIFLYIYIYITTFHNI